MVRNSRLKVSGITRTSLLNDKSELHTTKPTRQTTADHIRLTIEDLIITGESRDTDTDSDDEISTNDNADFKVPSCQPINRVLRIFQTELCRVVDEAKTLVPCSLSSTRARTEAAAQETSGGSPTFDGRCRDDESLDTANT